MEQVSMGNHPAPPEGCPDVIKCLMLSCWARWSKDRIDFCEIVNKLSKDILFSGAIHQNGLPDMSANHQALRDSIFGGTGTDLSRLQWPRNSIPRRVKKLSWEDESYDLGYDRDISTFTDPDVSVTPLELQLEPSQVGRAIYF